MCVSSTPKTPSTEKILLFCDLFCDTSSLCWCTDVEWPFRRFDFCAGVVWKVLDLCFERSLCSTGGSSKMYAFIFFQSCVRN